MKRDDAENCLRHTALLEQVAPKSRTSLDGIREVQLTIVPESLDLCIGYPGEAEIARFIGCQHRSVQWNKVAAKAHARRRTDLDMQVATVAFLCTDQEIFERLDLRVLRRSELPL